MSYLDKIIKEVTRTKPEKGDIGIEIECEGTNLQLQPFIDNGAGEEIDNLGYNYWRTVKEGSLRGGIEYILRKPCSNEGVKKVLELWKSSVPKAKFSHSLRTSVHVHINVQRLTLRQVYNVIGCYWLLENVLVKMNGKDREGNLHCLRAGDAEFFVYAIIDELKAKRYFSRFDKDGYKYSALNVDTINRFGSLEFRFMKGMTDIGEIGAWAKACYDLVHSAKNVSPDKAIELITTLSPKEFLLYFLGASFTSYVFSKLSTQEIEHLCYEQYCYTLRLGKELSDHDKSTVQFQGSEDEFTEPQKPKPIWVDKYGEGEEGEVEEEYFDYEPGLDYPPEPDEDPANF